ncbi:uncharacterized protein LOC142226584 [Haematobia irritans]|uniref:uncharacterized protein LOC142226584 n=1 Tax=Haematobia irritans TaxID=7368 RepID=UPI003F501780
MERKCLKKSTMQQLKALTSFMEANPDLARGIPVFGSTRISSEEQWQDLTQELNSLGPPTRSTFDWKKTWTDLKSRTKKKIASNKKSLVQTGGGLYRFSQLSELEESVDRTLHLSSAAAPSGSTFGIEEDEDSLLSMEILTTSPDKVVITSPTCENAAEKKDKDSQVRSQNKGNELSPCSMPSSSKKKKMCDEKESSFSCKKKKTTTYEQLELIRRQLKLAEQNSMTTVEATEQIKRLAEAAERIAVAAETQAQSTRKIEGSLLRIEESIENFLYNN